RLILLTAVASKERLQRFAASLRRAADVLDAIGPASPRQPRCAMLTVPRSRAEQAMSKPKPSTPEPHAPVEDRLDEALDETFPASDPIAVDPEEEPAEPPTKEKKRH